MKNNTIKNELKNQSQKSSIFQKDKSKNAECVVLKAAGYPFDFEMMENNDSADYYRLYDIFQKGRNDNNLKQSIFKLSNFLAAHIDGDKWFKKNIEISYNPDIETNKCAIAMKKYFSQTVTDYLVELDEFLIECADYEKYYNMFLDLYTELTAFKKEISFKISLGFIVSLYDPSRLYVLI